MPEHWKRWLSGSFASHMLHPYRRRVPPAYRQYLGNRVCEDEKAIISSESLLTYQTECLYTSGTIDILLTPGATRQRPERGAGEHNILTLDRIAL